jgi:hypothetical protein
MAIGGAVAVSAGMIAVVGTALLATPAAAVTPPTFPSGSPVHTYTVTTTADPVSGTACPATNSHPCSLRAAVSQADSDGTLDEIVLGAGTYTLEDGVDQGVLDITDTAGLIISGNGASSTIIQRDTSAGDYGVLESFDSPLQLSGFSAEHGSAEWGGGIYLLDADLFASGVTVWDNYSTYSGGGIYANSGSYVSGTDLTVSDNYANDGNGGGLYSSDTDGITLSGSTVSDNTSWDDSGGGIYVQGGPAMLTSDVFSDNAADSDGGAVYLDAPSSSSSAFVADTVTGNEADSGGGVYQADGGLVITDTSPVSDAYVGPSKFTDNVAWDDAGGALYLDSSDGTQCGTLPETELYGALDANVCVTDTTFHSNVAVYSSGANGGAIRNENAYALLSHDTLTDNSALSEDGSAQGGAIYNDEEMSITGSTINSNSAVSNGDDEGSGGGAVYSNTDYDLSILHSKILNNSVSCTSEACSSGGGALFSLGETVVSHSKINGTSATAACTDGECDVYGGAIYQTGEMLVYATTIDHTTATASVTGDDDAYVYGGAIYADGEFSLYSSDVNGTSATATSGQDGGEVTGGAIDNVSLFGMQSDSVDGTSVTVNVPSWLDVYGGAIANGEGGLWLESSAIVGTTEHLAGPYVASDVLGGGIYESADGTFYVKNDTIANNTGAGEGGGIYYYNEESDQPITNLTISGNAVTGVGDGGAIFFADATEPPTVTGTILAGNTAYGLPNECANPYSYDSGGYNIDDTNSCLLYAAGDQVGVNPDLASLGHWGMTTMEFALLPGSPAIAAENHSFCPETDQHGIARPASGPCDIGAAELVFQPVTPSETDTVHPSGTVTYGKMVTLNVNLSGSKGIVFGSVRVSLGTKGLCHKLLVKGSMDCTFNSHALGHGSNTLTVSFTREDWYLSLSKDVVVKTS